MNGPTRAALEAYAAMEAEHHQPENGGDCTCGFCAWSVAHVVIMSIRDAWGTAMLSRTGTHNV